MDAEILVLPDAQAVAHEAARRFAHLASEAAKARGRFSVALSGGSTPGALFRRLAEPPRRHHVPWAQIHLFWADERLVPPDDPGSNYRLAHESLIAHVPIPDEHIHRVRGEWGPEAAAGAYAKALQAYFCGPQTRFDLVLLGMGSDGHTASLFPGAAVLQEETRKTAAVEASYEGRPTQRVTLTLPAINSARHVQFLVTGVSKAEVVRQVLEGSGEDLPAKLVQPIAGQLLFLLDEAAASLLVST